MGVVERDGDAVGVQCAEYHRGEEGHHHSLCCLMQRVCGIRLHLQVRDVWEMGPRDLMHTASEGFLVDEQRLPVLGIWLGVSQCCFNSQAGGRNVREVPLYPE